MEAVYNLSGILLSIAFIAMVVGLIRPTTFKKPLKEHATRKFIAIAGIASVIAFSGLLGATEPESIRQARLAKENAAKLAQLQSEETKQSEVKTASIEKKEERVEEEIDFSAEERKDSSLASGTSKVVQQGAKGEKTLTYEVTYTNGQETDRKLIKEEVTLEPVAHIVAIGTYVAPQPQSSPPQSRTYAPPAPSTPTQGPTAKCRDGTYSYSQNRRGTCSHHGGVAIWY